LGLESSLPCSQTWRFSVENKIIPLFPKTPDTYHENVHEERFIKCLLCNMKSLMHIMVISPNNAKIEPSTSSRMTFKKINGLSSPPPFKKTHDTVIALIQYLSSSP
jgi:hypothetical protein